VISGIFLAINIISIAIIIKNNPGTEFGPLSSNINYFKILYITPW
jgi:hypothetical protein